MIRDSWLLRGNSPYNYGGGQKKSKREYELSNKEKKFLQFCTDGNMKKLVTLVREYKINPTIRSNQAIINASKGGHIEVVKYLIKNHSVKPQDQENMAIRLASRYGKDEVLEILLDDPRTNPGDKENEALRVAAAWGHRRCVVCLLRDREVDPTSRDCEALRKACKAGHVEIVRMLLEDGRVIPYARNNSSLLFATQYGGERGEKIVSLLLSDDRVMFESGLKESFAKAEELHMDGIISILRPKFEQVKALEAEKGNFARMKKEIIRYVKETPGSRFSSKHITGLIMQYVKVQTSLEKTLRKQRKRFLKKNWEVPVIISSIESLVRSGFYFMPIGQYMSGDGSLSGELHYFGLLETKENLPDGYPSLELVKQKGIIFSTFRVLYVGQYVRGKRGGMGKLYTQDVNNRLSFQGQFSDGLKHGRGVKYHKDGVSFSTKGEWRKDQLYKIDLDQVVLDEIKYSDIRRYLTHENLIGKGAYGSVYKVQYRGRPYAFKVLSVMEEVPSLSRVYIEQKTFETLKLCGSLRHQNILKIFGYCKTEKTLGYLMEICLCSISAIIAKKKGTMQKFEVLKILLQTALGMQYLHENGIMHRDLKWENCLKGNDGTIKITDFEFSKLDETDFRASAVNLSFLGPFYMAPEIAKNKSYDKRCDVFSFGMMMYCLIFQTNTPYSTVKQCICGTTQFQAATFTSHVANCNLRPLIDENHPSFEEFCWGVDLLKLCWDKNPDRRPSFDEIVEIIRSKLYRDKEEFVVISMNDDDDDEEEEEDGERDFQIVSFTSSKNSRRRSEKQRRKSNKKRHPIKNYVKKKALEKKSFSVGSRNLEVLEGEEKRIIMINVRRKNDSETMMSNTTNNSQEKVILSCFSVEGLREAVLGKFGKDRHVKGMYLEGEDAPFEIREDAQVANLEENDIIVVEFEETGREKRMSIEIDNQNDEIAKLRRIVEIIQEKNETLSIERNEMEGKYLDLEKEMIEMKEEMERKVKKLEEELKDSNLEREHLDTMLNDYVAETKSLRMELEAKNNNT